MKYQVWVKDSRRERRLFATDLDKREAEQIVGAFHVLFPDIPAKMEEEQ